MKRIEVDLEYIKKLLLWVILRLYLKLFFKVLKSESIYKTIEGQNTIHELDKEKANV